MLFDQDDVAETKEKRSQNAASYLNECIFSEHNCIALSYARRFGKSQAARMIDTYYSIGKDSKELFSKFKIAEEPDFEEHLNKYNVIHLDIASVSALSV